MRALGSTGGPHGAATLRLQTEKALSPAVAENASVLFSVPVSHTVIQSTILSSCVKKKSFAFGESESMMLQDADSRRQSNAVCAPRRI